jgi:nucleotide-binding universal stress UspA family protein
MTLPARLVTATDFSLHARRAARRAALLAKEHQIPLTLLHALEVDGITALTARLKRKDDIQNALAEQARVHLGVAADEVRQQVGVSADIEVRHGVPLAVLAAAGDQAGMLVLGARGAHAIRELALGTTADRLLRKTHMPVLVVKSEPSGPYRKVLALVDFSSASREALAFALELAPRATFRLLHAFELPYEGQLFVAGVAEEEVQALLEAERLRAHEQFRQLLHGLGRHEHAEIAVEHGDVRRQAVNAVKDFAPDLVVVGKQGRSFAEDFFLGSVTRAMLSEVPCDVLMTPGAASGKL